MRLEDCTVVHSATLGMNEIQTTPLCGTITSINFAVLMPTESEIVPILTAAVLTKCILDRLS